MVNLLIAKYAFSIPTCIYTLIKTTCASALKQALLHAMCGYEANQFFKQFSYYVTNISAVQCTRSLRRYFAHDVRLPRYNNGQFKAVEGSFLFVWLHQNITRNAG